MSVINTVKAVTNVAVSIGVSSIVGNAIKITTPDDVKTVKKVCMMVGGFVLGAMVSDAATTYTESSIDGAVKSFTDARDARLKKEDKSDETIIVNENTTY